MRLQLLAAFVAFHVLSVVVLALPGNWRLGQRAVWQSPENQLQFGCWAQIASSLGFARTGSELEEQLWQLTQRYLRVRNVVAAPLSGLRSRFFSAHNDPALGRRCAVGPGRALPARHMVPLADDAGHRDCAPPARR